MWQWLIIGLISGAAFGAWLRSNKEHIMPSKKILEVDTETGNMDKQGNMFQLLNAAIKAYNHRTDVIEKSNNQSQQIRSYTNRLRKVADTLEQAVKQFNKEN